jgi:protein gp37
VAEHSAIEWLNGGSTWNPIRARNLTNNRDGWHCEHVTEACRFCYAENMNRWRGTRLPFKPGHRRDVVIYMNSKTLMQPLRWKQGRRIFPCSMTDLYGDWVKQDWLYMIKAVQALTPQHDYIELTKRPARMLSFLNDPEAYQGVLRAADLLRLHLPRAGNIPISNPSRGPWWPHLIIGVSIENQETADMWREIVREIHDGHGYRIVISYEPALGPVDWTGWEFISWAISGGESGSGARPSHPDWHRRTRDWCGQYGIEYQFKQWGVWAPSAEIGFHGHEHQSKHTMPPYEMMRVGKKAAGRSLDGRTHDGYPEVKRR